MLKRILYKNIHNAGITIEITLAMALALIVLFLLLILFSFNLKPMASSNVLHNISAKDNSIAKSVN